MVSKYSLRQHILCTIILASLLSIGTVLTVASSYAAEWGTWSEWQDAKVDASGTRQVEIRQVVDSYNMETWVYTDQSSPNLRGYWPNATGNTLRAHYTETWPKSLIDNPWRVINANTFYDSPDNDNCDGQIHDARAYVVVDGQGHSYVPFFIKGENYKTQYRYRDQIIEDVDISSAVIDSKTDPGTKDISYNGKPVEDNISVTLNGRLLTKGTDYTISYDKSIRTGKVIVTINGKGRYNGSCSKTFTIIPPKTIVNNITVDNNQIIVYWDEVVEGADGYEIQTSLNSDFSDAVTTTVQKRTTTTCVVSGLNRTGTYYVRIRAYCGEGKDRYYSNWSPVKTVYVVIQEGGSYDLSLAKVNPISDKTYTGKAIKPNPTIVNGTYVLQKGVDYTVKYKNNIKIGTATVIMTGKGKYYNSCKATFRIVPKGTKITKLSSIANGFKVKWKKNGICQGYQIAYSTDPSFNANSIKTIKGTKKISATVSGLPEKTTYYVKVRTYCGTGSEISYSTWSKAKDVTTNTPFSTSDQYQYRCIKSGDYIYCGVGSKLVKVNIITKKTKTVAPKINGFCDIDFLCAKDGYIYYWAYDGEDYSYAGIYRVRMDGKNAKKLYRDSSYKTRLGLYSIKDDRIFYEVDVSESYYMYKVYSMNLDGSDVRLEATIKETADWDVWEDVFNYEKYYKICNVKGYKVIEKEKWRGGSRIKRTIWIKMPGGKKVKAGSYSY